MRGPLFSVVIPVHNRAPYLPDALRSALDQKFPDFEVLVVDDGSTDGGPEAAEALGDPRLRVERLPHAGAPAARNAGIRLARGEYLVWLDSDDALEPGALAAYAKTLAAHPGTEVLYGRTVLAGADLGPVRTVEYEDWHRRNRELLATLVFRCPLPHPGAAVARGLYEREGGYDERFRRAHDYEFWTRVALKASFKYVKRPVCRWRWHDANMSAGSVSFDTDYELDVVRGLLGRHPMHRILPRGGEAPSRLAARLRELGDENLAREIERANYLSEVEEGGA
jgi:glycosyltransferase involved in cell wall biosynthesis